MLFVMLRLGGPLEDFQKDTDARFRVKQRDMDVNKSHQGEKLRHNTVRLFGNSQFNLAKYRRRRVRHSGYMHVREARTCIVVFGPLV